MMKSIIRLVGVLALAVGCFCDLRAEDKPKITSQDQLPRFSYPVNGKATDVLTNEQTYAALAAPLRKDLQGLLDHYDIEDPTTLNGIEGTLMLMDFLDGKYSAAEQRLTTIRRLEPKPANKLTSGILLESVIEARKQDYATDQAFRAAFAKVYAGKISALPYDVVSDNLKSAKAGAEIVTPALLLGSVESEVQPGLDKTGTVSGNVAQGLVAQHANLQVFVPLKAERVAVLGAYLKAHAVTKADIWAARDITLPPSPSLTPVIVGIWDSGLDVAVYPDNLWTNEKEKSDGKDDDGDGFVDDVHGIAFDLHSNAVTSLLFPLTPEQQADYPEMAGLTKGLLDLQSNIDSPEAGALRARMAKLKPSDVKPFIEQVNMFGNFTHGTHVAGIAIAGNPAARLLEARITFDYRLIPDVPTVEQAKKDADATMRTVAYFRRQGVRVVNMSWGGSPQGIEHDFEANGAGGTPEERHRKAREIFDIGKAALTKAMADAPDILFVVAAGNSDNNAEFSDLIPSGIRLPNILTVGAVDQAGEETSFSTFGPNVAVHADGFEVPSKIPGGQTMKYSGTSMAAPNVTNLAAKLLALDPKLSVSQVVSLITLGAERSANGRINLINPKRSCELLQVLQTK